MTHASTFAAALALTVAGAFGAHDANRWVRVSEDQVGPRSSPALVWVDRLKRFVLIGGSVSHQFTGERPYDVQSMDATSWQWQNDLPASVQKRGSQTGGVTDPGFSTPYFAIGDKEGLVRPNPRQFRLWHQYAYAPWDGKVYALLCGRTLCYDPAARTWADLKPGDGPMPETRSCSRSLSWGALCADPVNREIVLFGGGGLATERGGPGTWVYSTEKNAWCQLRLKVQPPQRALSPMVFDAKSKRIILFGGDRLDMLYADTWVYDPVPRSWEERRPAVSPSPRFGHALVFLPKPGTVVLLGGKGYLSPQSRSARMYRVLPFEMWTYDAGANTWRLIRRIELPPRRPSPSAGAEAAPPQYPALAAVAAADAADKVLLIGRGPKRSTHSTWLCAVDPSTTDDSGTTEFGVKPGTTEARIGPYDPEWYARNLPKPDPAAVAGFLKGLPANTWTPVQCPKWPRNRAGGGWSTTAFDPDRDQILHLGGGHVSYFGNDPAHYDIKTGRWSIGYPPQYALEYNYGLSGPGPWAFNLGPWGNHNYQAYAYDPTCKRLVYIKEVGTTWTQMYDPVKREWPFEEKITAPFAGSKYTTYVCPTPKGLVAWAPTARGSGRRGLWRLEGGTAWRELPIEGEALPTSVCDGSTLTYDSTRDRLVFTTTSGSTREPTACGQVWSYDFKKGTVAAMDPAGMGAVKVNRFAREAVYLPTHDKVMLGYIFKRGETPVVPFYDCAGNRWLVAEVPGSEFMAGRGGQGCSVDLGLAYDAKRDLVWGVLCKLHPGSLQVLRLDARSLRFEALD